MNFCEQDKVRRCDGDLDWRQIRKDSLRHRQPRSPHPLQRLCSRTTDRETNRHIYMCAFLLPPPPPPSLASASCESSSSEGSSVYNNQTRPDTSKTLHRCGSAILMSPALECTAFDMCASIAASINSVFGSACCHNKSPQQMSKITSICGDKN